MGVGLLGWMVEDIPKFTVGYLFCRVKTATLSAARHEMLAPCDFTIGAEHLIFMSHSGFLLMSFSYFSFGGIVSFFRSFDPFATEYKGYSCVFQDDQ